MRVGIVLPADLSPGARISAAEQADAAGLDLLQVEGTDDLDPLLLAASLAGRVRWARIVAEVTAGSHPVHLAERICVADQALGGRLTVVIRSSGDRDELAETVQVLQLALSSRPFRHQGARWQIPARLPANDAASWTKLRVTPPPVQPQLPLWLTGAGAAEVALEFALPALDPHGGPDPGTWWAAMERRWGPAAERMTRPLLMRLPDIARSGPGSETASRLHAEQAAWGADTALLGLATVDDEAVRSAARVRATVQLDELPVGLAEFWAETSPLDSLLDG